MRNGFAQNEPLIVLVICGLAGGLLAYSTDSPSTGYKVFLVFVPLLILVAFFAMVAILFKLRFLRKRCNQCVEGRLEHITTICATCVDDNGKSYPDSRSYYLCDRCGDRMKMSGWNNERSSVSDTEWKTFCGG